MAGLGRKVFTAGDVLTASDVQNYMMDQSVMYFAGTAARSSAIATPTTGMTSYIGVTGTASIPQIETYTGSAWQTPYGLTQVANVSFSATSLVSIANVFSSTYANYRAIVHVTSASAGSTLALRLGNSGTPNSSSNYTSGGYYSLLTANTGAFSSVGLAGYFGIGSAVVSESSGVSVDLIAPQLTNKTLMISSGLAATDYNYTYNGAMTVTTAYTDLYLLPSAGNITGSIRIYGYRNS